MKLAVWTSLGVFLMAAYPPAGGQQQPPSRRFGPGACGPGDPAYVRLATETGGQPFFLSPSEVARSSAIMFERSRSDNETILWASAPLDGGAKEFTIPVDSSLQRVSISASFDKRGGTLAVTRPDGGRPPAGGRTRETILSCAHLLTVEDPETGAWRARVVASGRFWLLAHGSTELGLITTEFVRQGGRPGHEGLFRIHGQPLANAPGTLRVVVSDADVSRLQFSLVSLEAAPIQQLEMSAVSDDEFVGTVVLPAQPFRVAMTGTDRAGLPFQRMTGGLFHAERVDVVPPGTIGAVTPGATTPLGFTVRNAGPAARFRVSAAEGHQLELRVEPQILDLPAGGEATVTVWLSVPQLPAGTSIDLTVTATSEGPSPTSNGATLHLVVGSPAVERADSAR